MIVTNFHKVYFISRVLALKTFPPSTYILFGIKVVDASGTLRIPSGILNWDC